MNRNYIKRNIIFISILLFLLLYILINYTKPAILYNTDGSLRHFGVGYKNKTILPLWLFAIILAILCYLGISYYIVFPKIQY